MKNNNTVMIVIIALIVAGAAFFGGMKYQTMQTPMPTFGQGMGRAPGASGTGRFAGGATGGGARPIVGEIVDITDKSMTVKLMDGSSKIVNLVSATTYSETATASATSLKKGTRVATFGTANSDGSVNAQNVQINPMFRTGTGAGNGEAPRQ